MGQLLLGALLIGLGGVLAFFPAGRQAVPLWLFLAGIGMVLFHAGWRLFSLDRRLRRLEFRTTEPLRGTSTRTETPPVEAQPAQKTPSPQSADAKLLDGFGLEIDQHPKE